jgi:carbonic anhydrase
MIEDRSSTSERVGRRRLVKRSIMGVGALALTSSGLSTLSRNAATAQDDAEWSYEGDTSPDEWGTLDEDYASCSTVGSQSPIDIADASATDLVDVTVNFPPASPMTIVNNGHTVEVTIDPGSTSEIDGVVYELKQFHFHTPSEHAIDGEHQAMELHLVHKSADDVSAVLSVLLREGAANAALEPVFANMPAEAGTEQEVDVEIDPASFLPAQSSTFRFTGSLTTPPCSEGVNWLIFVEPVEISAEQIAVFQAIFAANARPLQLTNDRVIEEDSTT